MNNKKVYRAKKMIPQKKDLIETARQIRSQLVLMSHHSKASHLGSALSCVDILVALYWSVLNLDKNNVADPKRDRFILSKGHGIAALYATLAFRGILKKKELASFCQQGSVLEEHPGPEGVPGVEVATGSLGHGLSLGAGMALADKIKKRSSHVYVLLSDGECNEGTVWEAAMSAAGNELTRLCVIVDYNKWQATGRSNEVTALEPLKEKWQAFGWDTHVIDGHDMDTLLNALSLSKKNPVKPMAIIAHTIKGKGVSFMEDDNNWHYRIPDKNEMSAALEELKN